MQAVLPGSVGKSLVSALEREGSPAVGLCGADGRCYQARPLRIDGADLGLVGEVCEVRPELPLALLELGYVPVLASVAPLADEASGDPERLYNVNADHAAAPLAVALAVDALLFLSDVAAVRDAQGQALANLSPATQTALQASGALAGGMLPKVQAALSAAAAQPAARVVIASAERDDCILQALEPSGGTQILSQDPIHG